MTVETEDQTAPVQALTDERSGDPTLIEQVAAPEVERRAETWVRDDTRRLVKVGEFLHSRNVDLLLACPLCREMVKFEGRDNGGASLMGCGCCVRRWV